LVFAAVEPLAAWIRARPRLNALLERSGDPLFALPEKDGDTGWSDHAIIVGYGRVGEIIGDGLKAEGFPFVVVDEDRRRVEELRKRGLTAIYGDAPPLACWRRPARSVPGC
jgi:monovalent cation:H+ antiporter-2, CPA2 family